MLQIALLDDNMKLLFEYETIIENVIAKHHLSARIVCATNNVEEFLSIVYSGQANVCFMDINLGTNVNGISVAKQIRRKLGSYSVEIVFITGFAQFMQLAFRVKPFNYLLKPAKQSHFERELLRLRESFDVNHQQQAEILFVNSKSVIYKFIKDEIICLEHDGVRAVIHTLYTDAGVDISLHSIIEQLDQRDFVQCHRSTYVNKEYVTKVDFRENQIYLRTGYKCYLSRKYKKVWRQMYDDPAGFVD